MQILQGVHDAEQAHPVAGGFHLLRDLPCGQPLIPQHAGKVYQHSQPAQGLLGVHDIDLVVAAELLGQLSALESAAELGSQQHTHQAVPRVLYLLKMGQEVLGGGLAGGRQAFRLGQPSKILLVGDLHILPEGLLPEVHQQRDHSHPLLLRLFRQDIGCAVGQDLNGHGQEPPFFSLTPVFPGRFNESNSSSS